MTGGLRGRMVAVAVAATATALLVVLFLAGPALERRAIERTRATLLDEARLVAHVVEEPLARRAGSEELDPLVDAAAGEIGGRVTILAPDGRVLADSAFSGAALAALENHAGRPEVRAALAEGSGSAIRRSATVGEDLLYTAVAVRREQDLVGVSRVAYTLREVEAQARELRRTVSLALAVAFGVTVLLSAALSTRLVGPLREIMEAARQFAAGNLQARIRPRRSDELGELARILNLAADQLQTRLAENERERTRTEAILSSLEDGVLAVDQRGVVLLVNEALVDSLDLKAPVGRHYIEVVRHREVGELIQRALALGRRLQAEVPMHHRHRVFDVTAVPLLEPRHAPYGAVLSFHDVTERRRLERMRRDFVANASHELRTPLTSIRGFVEALEDGALAQPETAERFLGKIRTHADRMATLVEDLLELSRLESGERPPRWEAVQPAEVVEDVAASFASLAERKRISLIRSDGAAPTVVSDPERLRRILDNLVDNALKYTPEGGRVAIATLPGSEGGALVEVRDDGPGIAAEHLDRIFERFYRVDKARSRELGGTGLGLAIAKHLAESMGAELSVESELGRGSRFRVSLPTGREPAPAASG